jgi:hypothetical protein
LQQDRGTLLLHHELAWRLLQLREEPLALRAAMTMALIAAAALTTARSRNSQAPLAASLKQQQNRQQQQCRCADWQLRTAGTGVLAKLLQDVPQHAHCWKLLCQTRQVRLLLKCLQLLLLLLLHSMMQ